MTTIKSVTWTLFFILIANALENDLDEYDYFSYDDISEEPYEDDATFVRRDVVDVTRGEPISEDVDYDDDDDTDDDNDKFEDAIQEKQTVLPSDKNAKKRHLKKVNSLDIPTYEEEARRASSHPQEHPSKHVLSQADTKRLLRILAAASIIKQELKHKPFQRLIEHLKLNLVPDTPHMPTAYSQNSYRESASATDDEPKPGNRHHDTDDVAMLKHHLTHDAANNNGVIHANGMVTKGNHAISVNDSAINTVAHIKHGLGNNASRLNSSVVHAAIQRQLEKINKKQGLEENKIPHIAATNTTNNVHESFSMTGVPVIDMGTSAVQTETANEEGISNDSNNHHKGHRKGKAKKRYRYPDRSVHLHHHHYKHSRGARAVTDDTPRYELGSADKENLLHILAAVETIQTQINQMDLSKRLGKPPLTEEQLSKTPDKANSITPLPNATLASSPESTRKSRGIQPPVVIPRYSTYTGFSPPTHNDNLEAKRMMSSQYASRLHQHLKHHKGPGRHMFARDWTHGRHRIRNIRDTYKESHTNGTGLNTIHLCLSKTSNGNAILPVKKKDINKAVHNMDRVERSIHALYKKLQKGMNTMMDQLTDFTNVERTDIKANGDKIFTLQSLMANRFDELQSKMRSVLVKYKKSNMHMRRLTTKILKHMNMANTKAIKQSNKQKQINKMTLTQQRLIHNLISQLKSKRGKILKTDKSRMHGKNVKGNIKHYVAIDLQPEKNTGRQPQKSNNFNDKRIIENTKRAPQKVSVSNSSTTRAPFSPPQLNALKQVQANSMTLGSPLQKEPITASKRHQKMKHLKRALLKRLSSRYNLSRIRTNLAAHRKKKSLPNSSLSMNNNGYIAHIAKVDSTKAPIIHTTTEEVLTDHNIIEKFKSKGSLHHHQKNIHSRPHSKSGHTSANNKRLPLQ